jgi:dipeptidyl-peptidase-4
VLAAMAPPGPAGLAAGPPAGELLTNDLIHNSAEFRGDAAPQVRWQAGGTSYTALEPASTVDRAPGAEAPRESGEIGAGGLAEDRAAPGPGGPPAPEMELVSYSVVTGDRTVVCSARQLTPAGHARAVPVADYSWSADGTKLLVFTNTRKVWRTNTRGDYYFVDVAGNGVAEKVGLGQDEACMMCAKFSPDGQRVGWVMHNNLCVQELASGAVAQLTSDGLPGHGGMAPVINGNFDWAYEEELSLKDGWRWSPDSTRIAYWQLHTAAVQWFSIIDTTTEAPYTSTMSLPYPKVGTENATSRIGVVRVGGTGGAETLWMDLLPKEKGFGGEPAEHYLASLDWVSDRALAVQRLPRAQDRVDVLLADAATGESRIVFTEADRCWVDISPSMRWRDEGSFVWLSDRSGWRQIYVVTTSDGQVAPLATFYRMEVISIVSIDAGSESVFFIGGAAEEPTQRTLYSVALDPGKAAAAAATQLTPAESGGTHGYAIAPGGRFAVHTVSSFGTPPQVEVVSLPEHRNVRTMLTNRRLQDRLAGLAHGGAEFFVIEADIPDGAGSKMSLPAWAIHPPGYERWGGAAKTHPLLVYVYGGPGSCTVTDSWGDRHFLWHILMAQHGYVVISVDGRGTPHPKGRAWRKAQHLKVGLSTADDHAAAVTKLLADPQWACLDPERVGTWGWSGGGSSTLYALCRHPSLYKSGVAVAGNYDYLMYDSIWQERFMGWAEDPDHPGQMDKKVKQNYVDTSPIAFVGGSFARKINRWRERMLVL